MPQPRNWASVSGGAEGGIDYTVRFGPFFAVRWQRGRWQMRGLSGLSDLSAIEPDISGIGVFASETGTKVTVADPNNPNQLIWVDAKTDANGDLVPVDSRYDVKIGWSGAQATQGNDGFPAWVAVVGVAALLYAVTKK